MLGLCLALLAGSSQAFEHTKVIPEPWDWVSAQKEIGAKFTGTKGVTVILGDSNSYANQATKWVNYGKGYTDEEKAIMAWSHKGKKDGTNGWWLTSVDVRSGRSHTSASGVRADEYLRGGKQGLPPLDDIIRKYNPQVAYIALGTNDASANHKPEQYIGNVAKMVDKLYANGTMVIMMTVPTHPSRQALVQQYNEQIYRLGAEKKFAVADVYGAFIERRPGDTWNGTLNRKNNVHFTFAKSAGPATPENLRDDGYLLRCWVMVHKLIEVKKHAIDGVPHPRLKAQSQPRREKPKARRPSAGGSGGIAIPDGAGADDKALVEKTLAEGLASMRSAVTAKVGAGEKPWSYFRVDGKSKRGRVTGAGEKGLDVSLLGAGAKTIPWAELHPADLVGVAKKMKIGLDAKARFVDALATLSSGRKMTARRMLEKIAADDAGLKDAVEAALRVYK